VLLIDIWTNVLLMHRLIVRNIHILIIHAHIFIRIRISIVKLIRLPYNLTVLRYSNLTIKYNR
jgi:hypothetical protein